MSVKRFAICVAILFAASSAYAQSSLGIGSAEQTVVPSGGMFSGFFQWIGTEQREFYRSMTNALKDMREDGSAFWVLVGLSFLYGILHAAGPGHGKVVISSYMLANETALRRGVMLSFASSMLQAVSALVIVGLGFALLRGTSVSMTDATGWLEIASYALIVVFGLWLFWRKGKALIARGAASVGKTLNAFYQPKPALADSHHHDHTHEHTQHVHAHHDHDHSHGHAHTHDHHHGEGEVCASCGHAHMPLPSQLEGEMDLRSAAAAVFAVGLRPCSGAVVVLSFALLNGLYLGGIASVFAMAIGTAITVSTLATLAVTAKNTALKFSTSAIMNERIHTGIELFGASLLVLLGSLMLAGALAVQ